MEQEQTHLPQAPSKVYRCRLLSGKGTCCAARFEQATATQLLRLHFQHSPAAQPETQELLHCSSSLTCAISIPQSGSRSPITALLPNLQMPLWCLLTLASPTWVAMEQPGCLLRPGAVSILAHGARPVLAVSCVQQMLGLAILLQNDAGIVLHSLLGWACSQALRHKPGCLTEGKRQLCNVPPG